MCIHRDVRLYVLPAPRRHVTATQELLSIATRQATPSERENWNLYWAAEFNPALGLCQDQ